MGEVINFNTKVDLDASEMLTEIAEERPDQAFAIVWPNDGGLPTFHCSTGNMPVVLYRLNEFIHRYYNGDYEE